MDAKRLMEVELNRKLEEDSSLLEGRTDCFQLQVGEDVWHLNLSHARRVNAGQADSEPDLAIEIEPKAFSKLAEGRLNLPLALATRKIKVQGNPMLVKNLLELFG